MTESEGCGPIVWLIDTVICGRPQPLIIYWQQQLDDLSQSFLFKNLAQLEKQIKL